MGKFGDGRVAVAVEKILARADAAIDGITGVHQDGQLVSGDEPIAPRLLSGFDLDYEDVLVTATGMAEAHTDAILELYRDQGGHVTRAQIAQIVRGLGVYMLATGELDQLEQHQPTREALAVAREALEQITEATAALIAPDATGTTAGRFEVVLEELTRRMTVAGRALDRIEALDTTGASVTDEALAELLNPPEEGPA